MSTKFEAADSGETHDSVLVYLESIGIAKTTPITVKILNGVVKMIEIKASVTAGQKTQITTKYSNLSIKA